MPRKCKDPGGFIIPIKIKNQPFNALCDLGASASLFPLSIWNELDLGELNPAKMRLGMADGSFTTPSGSAENVLIKLNKFYIPKDFIIADVRVDPEAPFLLGRPFLATVGAKIDVKRGHMTFDILGEELEFIIEDDKLS